MTGTAPAAVPCGREKGPAAVRAVRSLDRWMGRLGGRRTVLVEVRTPMNLAVLRPVLEPLLDDRRLRVRFTSHPREDVTRAFAESGLTRLLVPRSRARWMRVDLYINADPWEALPLYRASRQLNFFHGVAGKYNLDCPTGLPLGFDRYDRVAFPNRGRLERYVAAGIVPREGAALIGYPKADALVNDAGDPRQHAAVLGLDNRRPTAIYAPTFSPASSLAESGEEIVRTLMAAGCNVIVKLHDRALDPDPKYNGGVDWRRRLTALDDGRGGFLFASSGDSTPYVLASDLMVTDHSSIGFEFCALDRPLIVFDAPGLIETARVNPEKVTLLRWAAHVVSSASALAAAVRDALASPGDRAAERRRAAAEVFHEPGGATSRALRLVYELLDLSPSPRPAMSRAAGAWSGLE